MKKESSAVTDAPKVKKRIQFDNEIELTESKRQSAKAIEDKPKGDFDGYTSRR